MDEVQGPERVAMSQRERDVLRWCGRSSTGTVAKCLRQQVLRTQVDPWRYIFGRVRQMQPHRSLGKRHLSRPEVGRAGLRFHNPPAVVDELETHPSKEQILTPGNAGRVKGSRPSLLGSAHSSNTTPPPSGRAVIP